MYFKIEQQTLANTLKQHNSVALKRTTFPILANTLVSLRKENLSLTTTDQEVELTSILQLNELPNPDNEGSTTIPTNKLHAICQSFNSADIQFNTKENQVLIKSGKSKFKLQTLDAWDFPSTPKLDNPTTFKIAQQHLKYLFTKTIFCAGTDSVRFYLNGLLLELSTNKITVVATDGHRMAVAMHEIENDQESRIIIPRKAVLELSKLLTNNDTEVTVLFDNNHIRFELDEGLVLTSKLIDGDFPNWQSVLPIEPDKIVIADTTTIKQALSRASILSNEKYKGIRLSLAPNVLTINAKNTYQEEAEEIVEVEYHGEELEIGFNGVYILDALNVIATKRVQFAFSDENSSCLLTEEDNNEVKYLVMPMRL